MVGMFCDNFICLYIPSAPFPTTNLSCRNGLVLEAMVGRIHNMVLFLYLWREKRRYYWQISCTSVLTCLVLPEKLMQSDHLCFINSELRLEKQRTLVENTAKQTNSLWDTCDKRLPSKNKLDCIKSREKAAESFSEN